MGFDLRSWFTSGISGRRFVLVLKRALCRKCRTSSSAAVDSEAASGTHEAPRLKEVVLASPRQSIVDGTVRAQGYFDSAAEAQDNDKV